MCDEIAEYRQIHENCVHVCLSKITVNPKTILKSSFNHPKHMLKSFKNIQMVCVTKLMIPIATFK